MWNRRRWRLDKWLRGRREVGAEKRMEGVALHFAARCCSELDDAWLYEEETWLEVVCVDVPDVDR